MDFPRAAPPGPLTTTRNRRRPGWACRLLAGLGISLLALLLSYLLAPAWE